MKVPKTQSEILRSQTREKLRRYLLVWGFRQWKDNYFFKGRIRVVLLKLKVRVEYELQPPIYKGFFNGHDCYETHKRISGAYWKHIQFKDGEVRGLGFWSNPKLRRFIYDMPNGVDPYTYPLDHKAAKARERKRLRAEQKKERKRS